MTDEMKILEALEHLDNIKKLIKDNEWEISLSRHLISMRNEFQRQLTCLQYFAKMKE